MGQLSSDGPDDRARAPRFAGGLCSGLARPLSRLRMTQGSAVTSAAASPSDGGLPATVVS